jgi:hypothetical protein
MSAMTLKALFLAFLVCLGLSAHAQLPTPSEDQIARFQAQREALFDARAIDVPRFSRDISAAVRDGEKLEVEKRYQEALDRLLGLQKYMPLDEIPSFDVHMLSGWLYDKLGQAENARKHQALAAAYRKLLWERIGTGASADEPLRVVMNSEAVEWAKSRLSRIVNVKPLQHGGRELLVVSYQGATTNNLPRELFVAVDPRTQRAANRRIDIFQAIPKSEMRPQDLHWLNVALEKRKRLLDDPAVPYLQLRDAIDKAIKAAAELDTAGKPQEALARLRELDALRPIEEIPTPGLLGVYSALTGKTGDTRKQAELRGLLFGVLQAIAHSGDGAGPATAIHVLFITEEYEWLREKGLKLVQQSLVDVGPEKFDAMTVTNAQGEKSTVYFNVTGMFTKYGQGLR